MAELKYKDVTAYIVSISMYLGNSGNIELHTNFKGVEDRTIYYHRRLLHKEEISGIVFIPARNNIYTITVTEDKMVRFLRSADND